MSSLVVLAGPRLVFLATGMGFPFSILGFGLNCLVNIHSVFCSQDLSFPSFLLLGNSWYLKAFLMYKETLFGSCYGSLS